MKNLAILGGGPAALMLAAQINTAKYKVTLFEKNKAVGRKFLVAGEGGLNLTFNSSVEELASHYFPAEFMETFIHQFNKDDLRNWFDHRGITTFTGSSNRVFPDFQFKPIEVLNKILEAVLENKIEFKLNTKWTGWTESGQPSFEKEEFDDFDIVVFALGGASWKVTGSDGGWNTIFEKKGVNVLPFRAANCAFGVNWEKNFIHTHKGKPMKNITLKFDDYVSKGELVVTEFGLEGNAIYALSQKIQDQFETQESVIVQLDLKPTMMVEHLKTKYKKSKHSKVTDILKEDLNLDRTSIGLLKHFTDKETFLNADLLAESIKSLPIVLDSADGLDRAISSLGGISLDEVTENLELKKMPNSYVIGEMLDWYAPTGGYLLQGCFSMGFALAEHLNNLKK